MGAHACTKVHHHYPKFDTVLRDIAYHFHDSWVIPGSVLGDINIERWSRDNVETAHNGLVEVVVKWTSFDLI